MISLARIADKGPLTAAALSAVLLMGALWLPALMMAGTSAGLILMSSLLAMACLIGSAAVVCFVALRHGEAACFKVIGICLLLLIVVSAALYGTAAHIPIIASVFWLPAIVSAVVLARTVRFSYAVLAIAACGVLAVLMLGLVLGDSTAFWRSQLGDVGAGTTSAINPDMPNASAVMITDEQREEFISVMANAMTGAMGISVMSIALCALCLARSWQAGLFNPGGFREEFHGLSFGRQAAGLGVLIIALSLMANSQLAGAIAMVVIFLFFIQGLAVAHALVRQRGMHRMWLHGLYILLLLPHTLLLLAALGLADNVFRLRSSSSSSPGD